MFNNTDECVYVESDTWQRELKVFPNPLTQRGNPAYTDVGTLSSLTHYVVDKLQKKAK